MVRGSPKRRVDLELRVLDVLLSGVLLIIASPVIGLIRLALLLTSGRPLLYRGARVGKDGRIFEMLKFRTLRRGAEERLGPYLGPALVERTRAGTNRLGGRLRGGASRPVPRPRARRANARGDAPARWTPARDAARRAAAALERPPRRHEPRGAAPDPAAFLRAAGRRAPRVLAAARRPAGPHRVRAGAPRLRDFDGREARPRPRVDRRPLRLALPANPRRDRD